MTVRKQTSREVLTRGNRFLQPIRRGGGSAIVTIPKQLMSVLDLKVGDRLLIQFDPSNDYLVLERDTESARESAAYQSSNLKHISNLIRNAHTARDHDEWEVRAEKVLWAFLRHLRGERLERNEQEDEDGGERHDR